jgi:F-type H+-transporting ATPase subunit gamma
MKGQELKHRISGVNETVKITKAMQMISTSKMHKSQQKFDASKKYLQEVKSGIRLLMTPATSDHPYFNKHDGDKIGYIVISDDKGLCGDYNHVILDTVYKDMQSRNVVKIFTIGHMAKDFFKNKGVEVSKSYLHLMQDPMPDDARIITNDIIERFVEKKIDKIYLAFTEVNTLSDIKITIKKILPVNYVEQKTDTIILSKDNDISNMLNQYVWAEVYYALSSASLAVNYKRMISMQQSTTNGEEMIEDLVLQYNHKRQESITTELVDSSASLQGKRL